MTYLDFLLIKPQVTIFGCTSNCTSNKIPILGIPLEETISYRPGTRFSTQYIRLHSQYFEISSTIELYKNIIDKICDLGDLNLVYGNLHLNIERIEKVFNEILTRFRKVIVIGGEHTISLPIAQSMNFTYGKLDLYVYLDAHLDLRDEWPLGQKISHATQARRILENVKPKAIFCIGYRAYDLEEIEYAKSREDVILLHVKNVKTLSNYELRKYIRSIIENFVEKSIYVSIDLDVFDPSICPGVSNPEAFGLTYRKVYVILESILDFSQDKYIVIDLCEYNPIYDSHHVTLSYIVKLIVDIVNLLS